jgi:hypothetical protein
MNYSVQPPFSGFSSGLLKAMLWIGRVEEELAQIKEFPRSIWVRCLDNGEIHQFDIIYHQYLPLLHVRVDELKIRYQEHTFYVAHIRNWTTNSQILSTIRQGHEDPKAWTVQASNTAFHSSYSNKITVWSYIDLPHTEEFLKSERWWEGMIWEEFYIGLLYFIPELP